MITFIQARARYYRSDTVTASINILKRRRQLSIFSFFVGFVFLNDNNNKYVCASYKCFDVVRGFPEGEEQRRGSEDFFFLKNQILIG